MTGHVIHIRKGVTVGKDGKIRIKPVYRDASHAIRAKSSKKQKPVRRVV